MQETKYALFWNDGWQPNNGSFAGLSLDAFIARCAKDFGPPVAWAQEWTFIYGGDKTHKQLHAESVAAGRLIECIDGKYVARGAEDPELLALQTRPQHEPAAVHDSDCSIHNAPAYPAGPCDCNSMEAPRPPLAYFSEAKRFDPFPGFSVTSDCAVEAQPDGCFRGLRLDGCGSFRAPKVL